MCPSCRTGVPGDPERAIYSSASLSVLIHSVNRPAGWRRSGPRGWRRDAEQVAADQQRHDHGDGADPDLAFHHLRDEDVVLDLLLHDEEEITSSTFLNETDAATAIAGIADRTGPTIGISSPIPEISAST
jgi:hypothetical protein